MNKSLKIMIIEDNALEAMGLNICLQELEHEVIKMAYSGAEAIDFIKENAPDFILSDINLGQDDGVDVMRRILEIRDVPFVFITGYSDERTVERAAQLRPYGYLVKPVDFNDVRSALPVALEAYHERMHLKQELEDSRRKLSERKLIERAKGILMDSFDLSEADAMAFLQKKSRKTNRKLVDIAQSIIKSKEITGL